MFAEARTALKAAVGGATGGSSPSSTSSGTVMQSSRTYLGWKSFVGASDSLFRDVQKNGPIATIGLVQRANGESLQGGGSFDVAVRIYLWMSKGADHDFSDVDDLLEDIFTRSRDAATFDAEAVLQPSQMTVNSVDYDFLSHDGLLCIQMTMTFPDP